LVIDIKFTLYALGLFICYVCHNEFFQFLCSLVVLGGGACPVQSRLAHFV
jgi:hypothetical protein